MKKIIFSVFLTVFTINTFAQVKPKQNTLNHLVFKGVPIDGTLGDFVLKMKAEGFSSLGVEDGTALMQGDFAAYKNCKLGVATQNKKGLVSRVVVMLPTSETWANLSFNYISLKEMLTEKYGSPSEVVEEFKTSYQPRDDRSKMYELEMERCKYYVIYKIENGTVKLTMAHNSKAGSFVLLAYEDKINGDLVRAEALNDL